MRVLLLSAANSIHTIRWANAFAERGVDVHLVSQQVLDAGLSERVTFHALPHLNGLGYLVNGSRLKTLVNTISPDVVNAHYATGYGTLARAVTTAPVVLNVWGSDVFEFPEKSPLHKWWLRRNLRRADQIVSTSEAMAVRTRNVCPGLSPIAVVPFGVDPDVFSPSLRSTQGPCVIGTVKTLAPVYGIDLLLRAFALVPKAIGSRAVRLNIVGTGAQEGELRTLSANLGVSDRVDFLGAVQHDRVPAVLHTLDVFVALSRSESFGVAVIEASACGLPVVVSDAGGLPEVVVDGVTGMVVPGGAPKEAAEALTVLIHDADLRQRMGKAGREFVREHYTWSRSVDLMLATLERVSADRRGS